MKSKEQLLLEECVYPYHKMFKKSEIRNELVKYQKTLENLAQKLTEEAMAHASNGLLQWTDGDYEDYDDQSDQKTATMTPNTGDSGRKHGSGQVTVGGLWGSSGQEKAGALRVIVYNTKQARLDYFYFPKDIWYDLSEVNGRHEKLILRWSYSGIKDQYVHWAEKYRVKDFKAISTCR